MSIFKSIGKIISAPARGLGHALRTSGIPIVDSLGGDVEKMGNAVAGKGGFVKNFLGGGVPLALTALGGAGLAGSGPLAGILGKLGGEASGALSNTFAPGGKLALDKILTAGGEVANMVGAGKQRKSATAYNNAQIDQRNKLMSSILSSGPNLNQQTSSTPGIGSGTTGGY